jgi:CBS domain-containing protein
VEEYSSGRMEQKINKIIDFEDLRKLRNKYHESFDNCVIPHQESIINQVESVNEVHDLLIQRTIFLSESIMEDKGMGPPPVSYDFVLFGSGGRREQTLWSDQDNGIIYDVVPDRHKEEVEAYFAELSELIVKGLEEVGYPPCDGDVVCSNPSWRKPILQWEETLSEWFEEPHWENVRYILITADLRTVYGKGILTQQYKKRFYARTASQPSILMNMMQNTLRHKILLGIFGHLIKEQYGEKSGGIDIKYGAYIPMVNGIRLLALQSGILNSSTIERIHLLQDRKVITDSLAESWLEAFSNFLKFRTMTYYKLEDGHYTSNGILKAKELTRELIQELKISLRVGKDMQRYIERSLGRS